DKVVRALVRMDLAAARGMLRAEPTSRRDLWKFLSLRASIEEIAGDIPEAARWLRRAIKVFPRVPEPMLELIELYIDAGHSKEAKSSLASLERKVARGTVTFRRMPARAVYWAIKARVQPKAKSGLEQIRILAS